MRNNFSKIALTASLVLAMAFTCSCSTNDSGDPSSSSGDGISSSDEGSSLSSSGTPSLSSSSTPNIQAIPLKLRSVIGYGYDITGKYTDSQNKRAILDMNKLVGDNRIIRDPNLTYGEFSTIHGEKIYEYQSSISKNVSVGASVGAFSAEVEYRFGEKLVQNSQYVFATSTSRIAKDAFNIRDRDNLDKYFTDEFKRDLASSMTNAQIIERYGTHVMLGGVLGARLDYHYCLKRKAGSTATNVGYLVGAKAEANLGVIKSGGGASFEKQQEFSNNFDELSAETKTRAIGGKPELAQFIQNKQNYDAWINSIDGNETWSDYYPNGLIPISDLITDNGRKTALKRAIDEYLESKKITIEEPKPNLYETDFKLIRSEEKEVTDAGKFNNPYDQVYFNNLGLDIDEMRQEGYKTISFFIGLNLKEVDDGYQHCFIFSSTAQSDTYKLGEVEFEHSPGSLNTNWDLRVLQFENISISSLTNLYFVVRYDASGAFSDTWRNKDLWIKLVFKK